MGLNKPVDFTTAKLLKKRGFDEPVHQYYEFIRDLSSKQDKTWVFKNSSFLVRESDAAMFPDEGKNGVEVFAYSDRIYRSYNFKTSEDFISAPTIAEVVMWCFNKYKYSIEYSMNIPESGEYDGCYVFNGLIKGSEDYKLKIFYTSKDYPTIEKALEAAIEYTLNNLI